MNPQAAEELLDVIMSEDFVERRRKLDDWTRRWVATMHVEQVFDPGVLRAPADAQQRFFREVATDLRREVLNALSKDEVHALLWGRLPDNPNSLVLQMHVILQVPRELNAAADAAKAMMDMARGDK